MFIHIPRTGGTSIEKFFDFKATDFGNMETAQHHTLREYKKHYNIKKYFTFTFVRNPWERLVSWFIWSHAEEAYYRYTTSISRPCFSYSYQNWYYGRELLQNKEIKLFDKKFFLGFKNAFCEFINDLQEKRLRVDKESDNCNFAHNRIRGRWVMPQVKWLRDGRGNINLDYIGKFENYKNDFKNILSLNNIKYKKLSLHAHMHRRPNYKNFYTSEGRSCVEKLYKDDIEYFNYEF